MKPENQTEAIPCRVWDNVLLSFRVYNHELKRMEPEHILPVVKEELTFPSKAKARSAIWHEVGALISSGLEPVKGRFSIFPEPNETDKLTGKYEVEDSIENAVEMLGKGYKK